MDVERGDVASFETRKDAGEGKAGLVKLWLKAIAVARKEEEQWRKDVMDAVKRYRDEQAASQSDAIQAKFNILYSQVETQRTSVYNSLPIPDVRRRFDRKDPVGKLAAKIAESALVVSIDSYDFHDVLAKASFDQALRGRAISRVNIHTDVTGDNIEYQTVTSQQVPYDDFIRGPAKRWENVPWIAFRDRYTRRELVERFGDIGRTIRLDWVDGAKGEQDGDTPPDIFGRAVVYQIWDKEKRQVLYIAPSYKEAPLDVIDDPYGLKGFFPMPCPLYDFFDSESLVPVVPYTLWKAQAQELDLVTSRIEKLTRALKYRGVFAGQMEEIEALENAEDGTLVPSASARSVLDAGGLDKAIWLWPTEKLIVVIRELVAMREQIKQTIFEVTGIADIMRGQSEPGETLGAQQIKAEFGSLRLRDRQSRLQEYAASLLRLKLELIVELFDPKILRMMTSIGPDEAPDEAFMQAVDRLKNDVAREFTVDVETHSTIRSDMKHIREENAQFTQALGTWMQGAAPYLESGAMPQLTFIKLTKALSNPYQLGRQADDALDEWIELSEQKAKEAEAQPPQPDPEQQKMQADIQLQQQKLQGEMQLKQADLQGKQAIAQAEQQRKAQETEAKLAQSAQAAAMQHEATREKTQGDLMIKQFQAQVQAAMQEQQMRADEQHRQQQMQIEALKAEIQRYGIDRKAENDAAKAKQQADSRSKL